jgi:hypothetical protein
VLSIIARYWQVSANTGEALATSTQVGGHIIAVPARFPVIAGLTVVAVAALAAAVVWAAIYSRDAARQNNALTVIAYLVGLLRPEALPVKGERSRPPRRRPRRRGGRRAGAIPADGNRPPQLPQRRPGRRPRRKPSSTR